MKKLIFIVLMIIATCLLYATEDYRGGNGTLLRKEKVGNKEIEVRKFEISDYHAGLWSIYDENIYDDYIKKNKIGTLTKDKKNEWGESCVILDFYEICFIPENKENNHGDLWVKLSDKKTTGWVHAESSMLNPYANENYSYLESIESGTETYHIRQYISRISWHDWEGNTLKVRDKPGKDGEIIAEVRIGTSWFEADYEIVQCFNSVAITEEIESEYGYWVKIEFEKNKYGWIPGNLINNGGMAGKPQFYIPEDVILNGFDFSWI